MAAASLTRSGTVTAAGWHMASLWQVGATTVGPSVCFSFQVTSGLSPAGPTASSGIRPAGTPARPARGQHRQLSPGPLFSRKRPRAGAGAGSGSLGLGARRLGVGGCPGRRVTAIHGASAVRPRARLDGETLPAPGRAGPAANFRLQVRFKFPGAQLPAGAPAAESTRRGT